MIFLSFFTGKSPEQCWKYFHRHIDQIPLPKNRVDVKQYLLEKEEDAKYSTLGSYLGHIKAFGIWLEDTPWLDATRDDVFNHIKGSKGIKGRYERIQRPRKPLGKYSKYQRMVMLRDFYKWLLKIEDTPSQFRKMPFRKPTFEEQSRGSDAKVSKEEVLRMLSAAGNSMDRALVMLLLDSGFRAGEVSALDNQDVEFDEYGALVQHHEVVGGLKTGVRKVKIRITFAARYVREWMERHPSGADPDAPLFLAKSRRNSGSRLSSGAIWSHISKISDAAGIRHVHPHMFRHSCVSEAAKSGWGEEMMRLRFGWAKGSQMPSHYSHVEDEFENYSRKMAGLPLAESRTEEWTKTCSACDACLPIEAVQCRACGRDLRGK